LHDQGRFRSTLVNFALIHRGRAQLVAIIASNLRDVQKWPIQPGISMETHAMGTKHYRRLVITLTVAIWMLSSSTYAQPQAGEQSDRVVGNIAVNNADLVYRDGDPLFIEVQAKVEVFVYIFYHQSNGEAVMVFPNMRSADNRVAAEQSIRPLEDRRGIQFRVRGQSAVETLQVLFAKRPIKELDALVARNKNALPILTIELLEQWCENLNERDQDIFADARIDLQIEPGDRNPQAVESGNSRGK
jgi:hypothetical protein